MLFNISLVSAFTILSLAIAAPVADTATDSEASSLTSAVPLITLGTNNGSGLDVGLLGSPAVVVGDNPDSGIVGIGSQDGGLGVDLGSATVVQLGATSLPTVAK